MEKRRATIVAGWVVLVTAVLVAVPLPVWSRLPEPMAVHWSGGAPDGAMSRTANLLLMLVLWLAVTAIMVTVDVYGNRSADRSSIAGRARRISLPMLAGYGVLLVGVRLWTVWANLDRANWHDAARSGWTFVLTVLAGLAAGYAGWVLDRRIAPPRPAPREGERPRLDLRAGERAAWTGEVTSRLVTWIGVALGGLGAAAVVVEVIGPWRLPPAVMISPLILGTVLVGFGRVRVTADTRGLRVVFGPLGWPVQRVALERITDALVEDLRPMEVGGWGYRGLPGSAAVMLRGGPCLVVRYDGGRSRLVVSVDGADEAASVLNGLRSAPAGS